MMKKDEIIKLIYIISQISLASLLIFLISSILFSVFPSLESLIKIEIKHIFLISVFVPLLATLALSYIKISTKILTKLEELYPKVPFFIIGIGSLLFIILLYIFLYVSIAPTPAMPIMYFVAVTVTFFSIFVCFPLGIFLLIISLSAKRYLEGQVFFTLKKANVILNQVEDKNRIDTKNLNRYIYLSYTNIKKKLGKGLNLKPFDKSEIGSTLDLEYTFLNYLSYYIEFGDIEQRQSLKNNLETMLKSVNEKDEIEWRSLTPAILKLNEDIITYLTEINFDLTYQKLSRQSEWMLRNKETVIQVIGLIVPIILFILAKLLPPIGT